MKKFISFFLIIMTFMVLLTNCDNKNDEITQYTASEDLSDNTSSNQTDSRYVEDDLDEYNFNGYEFKIFSRTQNYFHGNIDVAEETAEVLDEAIYNRNRQLEQRFNFTFKEVTKTFADDTTAKNAILAGDNAYDMINTRIPSAYTMAQEGLLYPVTALPYIDLDKQYWHENINEDLTISNKTFFASGAFNLTAYDYTEVLLFNKKLLQDLDIGDLYTLVLNGNWTFDKFAEYALIARQDLNGDNNYTANDNHGYLATSRYVMPSFWIAGGVKTIYKDNDDIPYLAALDSNFIEVYNKILDCVRDNNAWYKAPSSNTLNDPYLINIFKSGNALFFDSTFYTIKELRDMEIDFGILPYPKLNERQEDYYTRLQWIELFCIPISANEEALERTSVILEALACESEKTVIPAYYEMALKTKMARDVESEDMIDILFNTRVFDFGDTIWCSTIRDGKFTSLFENNSRDLVSAMQSIESNVKTSIDKMVDAFNKLDD